MLKVLRPSSEMVKEGRILHFVSGDRRFEFEYIAYNEKYYLVDKRNEISNFDIIRDMERNINLTEISHI